MADQASTSGGLFGTLYSWGAASYNYASSTISSFMGWEQLDVVNPDSQNAAKATESGVEGGVLVQERKQAWSGLNLSQYTGKDLTSLVTVPVLIMEPFTLLQKMGEAMEYTDILALADQCDDADERLALVAAYTISPFGSCERTWKPFNPILGETYELEMANGTRYLAEQVSHHPPVGAAHAVSPHFEFHLVSAPKTRFLGNSLEVFPHSRTRIRLKRSNELFTFVPPNSVAHNLIIGRTWVDTFGTLRLLNATTGAKCEVEFTQCGWFGAGRRQIAGYACDVAGVKKFKLTGDRMHYVDLVRCDAAGNPAEGAEVKRVWTCEPKPEGDYYSFTKFARDVMNSSDGIREPLPSDSRRRPDRAALQDGSSVTAGNEKYRLEEMQRAERKEREKRGAQWTPRWFKLADDPDYLLPGEEDATTVPFWETNGEYGKLPLAPPGKKADIHGSGFNPWQFPEIHDKL